MKRKPPTPAELVEQIGQLDPEARPDSGFDAEKVRRLRAAIKEGRLVTDARKIADGLLGAAKARLKHRK